MKRRVRLWKLMVAVAVAGVVFAVLAWLGKMPWVDRLAGGAVMLYLLLLVWPFAYAVYFLGRIWYQRAVYNRAHSFGSPDKDEPSDPRSL